MLLDGDLKEIYFITYFLISQARFSGSYIDSLTPIEVSLMYSEHIEFVSKQNELIKSKQRQTNGINL